ncbi:ABC transporter ATP-binding protein [uncultured archaeon]|nr:ABC transporter ATP-binding protein [uncultured archaeon]HKJ97202.1 ABC transporter ATP-binding protein [Thermoplasmataceae archaeon]
MISIENVSKSYSPKSPLAVDEVTLEIKDGEILGLVGLNGAGKTTTIRMASGIILPTTGSIKVDGFDIVEDKLKASSRVGWIPEFPNFEPNAKPLPLMKYFAGFYDLGRKDVDTLINERLDSVGLAPYLNRKLRTYSQGMKKRFSIAESLIGDPQNVMFDETLNGLDPEGVVFVRKLIMSLKSEGKAILLSSHILTEVQNIADRVAIISHGKLIKTLTKDDMKSLGKEAIHITVDNPDGNLSGLLDQYGTVSVSAGEITITDLSVQKSDYPEIPALLISKGYRVRNFSSTGVSLEEYFFTLVGDKL